VIDQEIGDELTGWCRDKFAAVSTSFFGDDTLLYVEVTASVC
jgi:hypothetical protein